MNSIFHKLYQPLVGLPTKVGAPLGYPEMDIFLNFEKNGQILTIKFIKNLYLYI